MKFYIETERLIIRPLVPEDYKAAFKWCGDKDVNKYMFYPLYTNELDVKKWLETRDDDNPNNYDAGFVLKETNELIGSGGICYHPDRDVWEVGYNIRKDMWGKGLVLEALKGILKHIQKTHQVRELYGICAKANNRSRRVMEKLGLEYYNDSTIEKLDGSEIFEAIELRKVLIEDKYKNVKLDNKVFNEEEFYYEFKIDEKISENDFESLEKEINKLDNNCFVKLLRISGVYYNGDANNEMIDRISGRAFESKDELDKFLEFLEELKERDHRKIGKDLDLFCFSDYVGAGLPLYTPRGTIVKDELQKEIERVCRRYGFQKVSCPSLANIKLFETSGHAQKFNDELFRVSSPKGHEFVLKPVQCPHHTQIYASKIRSYKDLPIRYMESDKQYRAELQGSVGGLSRVYAITIEDGHSFCRIDQFKDEVINMYNIIKDFYKQ